MPRCPAAFAAAASGECDDDDDGNGDETVRLTFPIAVAFHPKYAPLGSTWNSRGTPSPSMPATRRLTPNGRTPPDCVYSCITDAVDLTSCPTGLVSRYSRKYAWADLRAFRTGFSDGGREDGTNDFEERERDGLR